MSRRVSQVFVFGFSLQDLTRGPVRPLYKLVLVSLPNRPTKTGAPLAEMDMHATVTWDVSSCHGWLPSPCSMSPLRPPPVVCKLNSAKRMRETERLMTLNYALYIHKYIHISKRMRETEGSMTLYYTLSIYIYIHVCMYVYVYMYIYIQVNDTALWVKIVEMI